MSAKPITFISYKKVLEISSCHTKTDKAIKGGSKIGIQCENGFLLGISIVPHFISHGSLYIDVKQGFAVLSSFLYVSLTETRLPKFFPSTVHMYSELNETMLKSMLSDYLKGSYFASLSECFKGYQ